MHSHTGNQWSCLAALREDPPQKGLADEVGALRSPDQTGGRGSGASRKCTGRLAEPSGRPDRRGIPGLCEPLPAFLPWACSETPLLLQLCQPPPHSHRHQQGKPTGWKVFLCTVHEGNVHLPSGSWYKPPKCLKHMVS